jgi:hypothetical protein
MFNIANSDALAESKKKKKERKNTPPFDYLAV